MSCIRSLHVRVLFFKFFLLVRRGASSDELSSPLSWAGWMTVSITMQSWSRLRFRADWKGKGKHSGSLMVSSIVVLPLPSLALCSWQGQFTRHSSVPLSMIIHSGKSELKCFRVKSYLCHLELVTVSSPDTVPGLEYNLTVEVIYVHALFF